MEPRIHVVTLGVADIARSRAFYETLGWKASESSNEHFALFKSQGCMLALFGAVALAEDAKVDPAGSGFRRVALAQNVPTKEAVKVRLEQAVVAGARLVKPAQDVFWGGHSGYYTDPDGHLWEVAWNPHWQLLPDGSIKAS